MPVNMDPTKKRRRSGEHAAPVKGTAQMDDAGLARAQTFGEETQEDREKDLAEAEQKNLWDATEVIDMDKV